MLPGMNPRQMQKMMKQMGIQQVEIPAVQVIIKTQDTELVFAAPQVSKVNMMGQETYQIVGTPEKRAISSAPTISEDDIQTVMDQTGKDHDTSAKAISEAEGDLAKAIMDLSSVE
tara:strand:+ start:219 stop:563 length:345 start_codon:yes stop_codon:yes gene_type:complete